MEHRWGERVTVDIPIRLTGRPFLMKAASLVDLSLSGAHVRASFDLRVLSRIQIAIDMPPPVMYATAVISAYIARKFADGIGVEWCEFAPRAVVELIRASSSRRGDRLRSAKAK